MTCSSPAAEQTVSSYRVIQFSGFSLLSYFFEFLELEIAGPHDLVEVCGELSQAQGTVRCIILNAT